MEQKVYLAALHQMGFSHKNLFDIFKKNQSYQDFYQKLDTKTLSKLGFSDKKIETLINNQNKIDITKLEKKLNYLNATIITFFEDSYPDSLKNIFNPPFLIYLRGILPLPGIAFVGSRSITSYGKTVIETLVPEVGKYFSIISGGAYGCDSYSHTIALKNGIKTISVIGTGIDINYPVTNKSLYDKIVKAGGGIISIFPLGEKGLPYNFPVRNEIVAGISEGIVIIEAKEKSGSLITAKLGLDLGKDIFAVPGDINKLNSAGCNKLISKGEAKIVNNSLDILSEYNISKTNDIPAKKEIFFNDEKEKEIYNLLLIESLNVDDITEKLKEDVSYTLLKISILELSGLIKKGDLGKYEVI